MKYVHDVHTNEAGKFLKILSLEQLRNSFSKFQHFKNEILLNYVESFPITKKTSKNKEITLQEFPRSVPREY